jgi:hypothetical protein
MGPALLPTPLSPTCGPPKGCLTPDVSPWASPWLCRPALAPVPDRLWAGYDREDQSPTFRSETGPLHLLPRAAAPEPGGKGASIGSRLYCPAYPAAIHWRDQWGDYGWPLRALAGPRPSSTRCFTVASIATSSFVSGSAGDPSTRVFPLSIAQRCRGRPSRARGASTNLSTLHGFRGGQEWISQRLAAGARDELRKRVISRACRAGRAGANAAH